MFHNAIGCVDYNHKSFMNCQTLTTSLSCFIITVQNDKLHLLPTRTITFKIQSCQASQLIEIILKPMTDARETRTKNSPEKLAQNRTRSI